MSKRSKDLYDILGVEKSANLSEIKNAYRQLVLRHHPDKTGDQASDEKFKEISNAYTILSDPLRRNHYDLTYCDDQDSTFEGFDVDRMSTPEKLRTVILNMQGVPVPIKISSTVLHMAKRLADGDTASSRRQPRSQYHQPGLSTDELPQVKKLEQGETYYDFVERQEAHFYTIKPDESECQNGVVILCHSSKMDNFKLILFDKQGEVRQTASSSKRSGTTTAEMYFVPFDHMLFSDSIASQVDKNLPPQFRLMDGFKSGPNLKLEPREHLLAVYGDNLYQNVKFHLQWMTTETNARYSVNAITNTEKELTEKKEDLEKFQNEFSEAKRKYDEACAKLDTKAKIIEDLKERREKAYDDFLATSAAKYGRPVKNYLYDPQAVNQGDNPIKTFVDDFFRAWSSN